MTKPAKLFNYLTKSKISRIQGRQALRQSFYCFKSANELTLAIRKLDIQSLQLLYSFWTLNTCENCTKTSSDSLSTFSGSSANASEKRNKFIYATASSRKHTTNSTNNCNQVSRFNSKFLRYAVNSVQAFFQKCYIPTCTFSLISKLTKKRNSALSSVLNIVKRSSKSGLCKNIQRFTSIFCVKTGLSQCARHVKQVGRRDTKGSRKSSYLFCQSFKLFYAFTRNLRYFKKFTFKLNRSLCSVFKSSYKRK